MRLTVPTTSERATIRIAVGRCRSNFGALGPVEAGEEDTEPIDDLAEGRERVHALHGERGSRRSTRHHLRVLDDAGPRTGWMSTRRSPDRLLRRSETGLPSC